VRDHPGITSHISHLIAAGRTSRGGKAGKRRTSAQGQGGQEESDAADEESDPPSFCPTIDLTLPDDQVWLALLFDGPQGCRL
jgi:hypothetical protein